MIDLRELAEKGFSLYRIVAEIRSLCLTLPVAQIPLQRDLDGMAGYHSLWFLREDLLLRVGQDPSKSKVEDTVEGAPWDSDTPGQEDTELNIDNWGRLAGLGKDTKRAAVDPLTR
jgi:hypothetical protein